MAAPVVVAVQLEDAKNDVAQETGENEIQLSPNSPIHTQKSFALTWKDLKYVPDKYKPNVPKDTPRYESIIRGISGIAAPGRILAIMGPSGSGKSTLLDVLAARKTTGQVTGEILVNGKQVPKRMFKKSSGYVLQDDLFHGSLSVFETLIIVARMRLPETIAYAECVERVERVIRDLGLNIIRNSKIGTEFIRGISGGEKKRLSIACELVANPSILFLDEPTSGLDSSSAYVVLLYLKKLADTGRTIVLTIHQPSGDLYDLLDDVLLVTNYGDLGYFGPAKEALSYFESNFGQKCPPNTNTADYLLKLATSTGEGDGRDLDLIRKITTTPEKVQEFVSFVKNERVAENIIDSTFKKLEISAADTSEASEAVVDDKGSYITSFPRQVRILLYRSMLSTIRDPMATFVMIIVTVVFGLIIGSIYYKIAGNQAGIGSRMGALFFITMNSAFSNMGFIDVFLKERAIFMRDRASKMYSPTAFFIGRVLPDLPILFFVNFGFWLITYFLMGLRAGADHFFMYVLVLYFTNMSSYALCLMVSSFSPNFAVANLVAPCLIVLFMLPSGFLLNLDNITSFWIWIKYISFFKFSYEALVNNEFYNNDALYCAASEFKPTGCDPTSSSCICPFVHGTDVLTGFGFNTGVYWRDAFIVLGFNMGFFFIALMCLKFMQKEKR